MQMTSYRASDIIQLLVNTKLVDKTIQQQIQKDDF